MKLFKIKKSLVLYVIAINKKQARLQLEGSDPGGENWDKFIETVKLGTVTEITSLEKIPKKDRDIVAYGGDDNQYYSCSIREFFEIKE